MLFDVYKYTHKADRNRSREESAVLRHGQKNLQASAGSYTKAKHLEKSKVRNLLENVKQKRQLAMSLTEVLHAPTITSTTTSFSTPAPAHEQAVGLERFEHADIQANLILRVKEVMVDEDIKLVIELVNVGKAPALLVKVDEIIQRNSIIIQIPEPYSVDDSYLNTKGKRLDPKRSRI